MNAMQEFFDLSEFLIMSCEPGSFSAEDEMFNG